MIEERLTLIDDGRVVDIPARFAADGVRIQAADVDRALGWEIKPEGLCRAGVCIPLRQREELINDDGIDLARLADVLQRPLALDIDARAAYFGASATERGTQLASLNAPDFTLPDLSGRSHSLSDYRGRKVLLIAYASW
jgi:Peroxiredoxin